MRKFISAITGALMMLALSAPLATIAKSEAVFFSIGTGGPTGVYFQVGNAVCKMVAKSTWESAIKITMTQKKTTITINVEEKEEKT